MAETETFWDSLPRPIIGLSPMNGITDHPFRYIQKKYGSPTPMFTEFSSVHGLSHGDKKLLKDFLYDESQRPIIAQIYGYTPDLFRQTAIVLCQLGFDGIDINMGCPAKSVAHGGSGAGLIKTPRLAQQIVQASKQGVHEWQAGATARNCPDIPSFIADEVERRHRSLTPYYRAARPIPVSVKTRIGYAESEVDEWIPYLLESEPVALSIHGRTLKQGYSGSSDWDEIGRSADIARGSETLILGNGDIQSPADARTRVADYGVDGALIGRASYGNPFIFNQANEYAHEYETTLQDEAHRHQMLHIALEHARLYEESFQHLDRYQFAPMRKHLGWYVRSLPGARGLRRDLTQTSSVDEVVEIVDRYFAYRKRWKDRVLQPAL